MILLRLFIYIIFFHNFGIYIHITEAPPPTEGQKIEETTNSKSATQYFSWGVKVKSTEDCDICNPMIFNDNATLQYINADRICYSALSDYRFTSNGRNRGPFKRAECMKKYVRIKTLHKGRTVSQTRLILTEVAKCYCLNKFGKDDHFYIANTKSKGYYAVLETVKETETSEEKELLRVTSIYFLGWSKKEFAEMKNVLKRGFFPPVEETTIPQKAFAISLLRGPIGKEKVSLEHVCKPLNDEGNLMLNYTNGDKACYMALKHPFIKEQQRYLLLPEKYKKASCLKRRIMFTNVKIPDREISKIVSVCYCINGKNDSDDLFYIGHTNKKYYYAIFEMMERKGGDHSRPYIKATAILNLYYTQQDLEEMENYFRATFTSIGAHTIVAREAAQMFMVRKPIPKKSDDHICSIAGAKKVTDPVLSDKICYLALGHPFVLNILKCLRTENYEVEIEYLPIKVLNAGIDFSEKQCVAWCTCAEGSKHEFIHIANTSMKNYYAILITGKVYDGVTHIEVVANLKLEPSPHDIQRMQKYFKSKSND